MALPPRRKPTREPPPSTYVKPDPEYKEVEELVSDRVKFLDRKGWNLNVKENTRYWKGRETQVFILKLDWPNGKTTLSFLSLEEPHAALIGQAIKNGFAERGVRLNIKLAAEAAAVAFWKGDWTFQTSSYPTELEALLDAAEFTQHSIDRGEI